MIKRTQLSLLAAAAILAGCARNEELGGASVDAVTDSPDDYIGRTITVRGQVEQLQGDRRAFTVEDHDWVFPEELLVVTPGPVSEMIPGAGSGQLSEGQEIQVSGTVRELLIAELERDYDFDLERDFELEFRERPILVADSLQVSSDVSSEVSSGQQNDARHPGATVPPPADSALVERDLPNVPVGDTTRDMNRESRSGATAATGAPVTDVLLIIPVPGPADLIGKPVHLVDIPVRRKVGDRGYWAGPSHTQQVFVRLEEGASAPTITPPAPVTVWGTLERVPGQAELIEQWDLDPAAAGILTRNEALYVKADSITAATSNQKEQR